MATSQQNALPSSAAAFACVMCYCVGLLQMPSPSDADQALVASFSPGAKSATLIDLHDASSAVSSASPSPDGDSNDATKCHDAPKSGMAQLKTGLVWLYQLVAALVVQVAAIASDVVSLKDRITAVEGTRTPAPVHGQDTEALTRQVKALCERVAFQEDRIAGLELSQRAETDSYRKTIQELTTKVDDDDRKRYDAALENLRQSFKNMQQSMECQAARVTGVKADAARKIALLQSELAAVQTELAAVKLVALPVDVSAAAQAAKEARKARVLASVARRVEDTEMAREIEALCPLPPIVARSSACATTVQDMPTALTSSGGPTITLSSYRETEETIAKKREITKEPLTTACTNVAQPGANKIPAMPMIPLPAIPLPMIPMGRSKPTKGSGKENKPCDSSTTTHQYTKPSRPGAGRPLDVREKSPTASPKKAQPGAGLPSEISALPKPRKSMLPAPRKSLLPSLAKHVAVVDGSLSNEVKIAGRLPGGSETQAEQLKTAKMTPIAISRAPLESAVSTLVEKEPHAVLSASSSLAALDAALEAMQVEDLLTSTPALNWSNDDLSFSAISPIPKITKRNDKYENVYHPPRQRNMGGLKHSKSPLKSTRAKLVKNEVSLSASSSLADLDTALTLQGDGEILTLMPGPDYPSMDFSFSAITPIFQGARPHCKRESIYVSPVRKSTVKPSRRL